MIQWPELLIVAGILALVGTYIGIIHRVLSRAERADETLRSE